VLDAEKDGQEARLSWSGASSGIASFERILVAAGRHSSKEEPSRGGGPSQAVRRLFGPGPQGGELATVRWGMLSSQHATMEAAKKRAAKLEAKGKPVDLKALLRMEPDSGTTNIRNVKSKHWSRWLGVEKRCVVPFNSFSEFNKTEGGDIWFANPFFFAQKKQPQPWVGWVG
jgi:putative SOS response-associated peptidase YedK